MKEISRLRLAFIGISHWHVPLFLPAVGKYGLNVAAVSDPDAGKAAACAAALGCKAYTDPQELLDKEKPDFVFAFGIHAQTAALSELIIRSGTPFSMEKPLGLDAAEVRRVKELAEAKGVYCSIPFIWRYTDVMRKLKAGTAPEDFVNLSYIFVCGPTSRYLGTSPWMLQNALSGGGCMTNLGVHFMDMACWFTGAEGADVLSAGYHYVNGYDVEDFAVAGLRMSSGCTLTVQTGYAYPMDDASKRDNHWNITTRRGYYTLGEGRMETRLFGRPGITEAVCTDADEYYPLYAAETLAEYAAGRPPSAGLGDMLRVRVMLDAIIEKAKKS